MGIDISPSPLTDAHGRTVRYLRLSVTDRCNLRCLYCVHNLGLTFIPHGHILSYEEMLTLIDIAVSLGIDKVRLTGGEPFVRKGFMSFLERARERYPKLDLRITTNATFLAPYVPALKGLGITTLNISFDTFTPEVFRVISGKDAYKDAEKGLHAALDSGIRVKINAVALRGVNSAELPAFLDFARRHPVDVRFIEYMPLGGRGRWTEANFWPASEILAEAEKLAELFPIRPPLAACGKEHALSAGSLLPEEDNNGPARLFSIKDGLGRFGLITPLSNHFCATCNRLRITSDGRLRTCLFSDTEYPLRDILRDPAKGPEAVAALIKAALRDKPIGYELLRDRKRKEAVIARGMSSIGG